MSTAPSASPVPDVVLAHWPALAGRGVRAFGGGLINHTFLVEGRDGPVVLQRLHPVFAGSVNEDIEAVTAHLAAKGLVTPRLLRTDAGALWVIGPENRPWRAQTLIAGSSVDRVDSPDRAREAGLLVAGFHRALQDLTYDYRHVRGNVHDTPRHLATLRRALDEHRSHRLFAEVEPLAHAILAAAENPPDFTAVPTRNTHGDLKISNLLFDASGRGVCLVDLDTVGRLPWPYEMGDALRSWCCPAGEDAPDNVIDVPVFRAALEGYASVGRDLVSTEEARLLVPGLATISLELSARFLADALNESYFGWNSGRFATRGDHNLLRARGQWSLHRSVVERREALDAIVREAFGG